MNPETTLEMIYRWLLEGKKIRHNSWDEKEFMYLYKGITRDETGLPITYEFEHPQEWELYQEPKEKEKWYQVISFNKDSHRPRSNTEIYKSKEDFLNVLDKKEENFHWIKLIEVDYE